MQKITPFLWFDGNAEEAMKFYVSIFKKSKVTRISRYGEAGPGKKGSVMVCTFKLAGQKFCALNGGPHFKITPAISFVVRCRKQREVDYYWKKLVTGGKELQCGWVTDKFGVSWQIVPDALGKLMNDKDPKKTDRVMKAMLKMVKLDIRKLERAYEAK